MRHERVVADEAAGAEAPRAVLGGAWAEDRTWVLCTDHGLGATEVVDPAPSVEVLPRDAGVEAVRLPWAP
ncbi:hypothetical protein GCM10010345_49730 [Streptomyces canarius]|uniref:Uncharacterized protein n=1 Tax=Streptomyces canarius TaxID=285453 RepID=A0ABQ3CUG1_9ACTN|nr:hypothetical protein GCM10010345_49730 [Streptomyces canarius]